MGAKDNRHIIRNLVQLLNKHRTAGAQIIDHKFIMYHFMAHIDRRAKYF